MTKCKHPERYRGEPTGYVEWFDWAEKKSKTHKQVKCPNCGLYKIWVRKEAKSG